MTTTNSQTHIRRQDRSNYDAEWITALLQRVQVGVVATANDQQPYLNSVMFVYDKAAHAIYFHSARSGRMPTMLAANERVCFTAFEMGQLLPASVAMQFSVEYASVVAFGRALLVEDEAEAHHALQQLLDKYFPHLQPGQDYRPLMPEEIAATAVYRIAVDEWSGKVKGFQE